MTTLSLSLSLSFPPLISPIDGLWKIELGFSWNCRQVNSFITFSCGKAAIRKVNFTIIHLKNLRFPLFFQWKSGFTYLNKWNMSRHVILWSHHTNRQQILVCVKERILQQGPKMFKKVICVGAHCPPYQSIRWPACKEISKLFGWSWPPPDPHLAAPLNRSHASSNGLHLH